MYEIKECEKASESIISKYSESCKQAKMISETQDIILRQLSHIEQELDSKISQSAYIEKSSLVNKNGMPIDPIFKKAMEVDYNINNLQEGHKIIESKLNQRKGNPQNTQTREVEEILNKYY